MTDRQETGRKLRILMMIHRQADNSPYCFYVHEQAKALRHRGREVVVISCVGVLPMMKKLRPKLYEVAGRTPRQDEIDGIPVYYPRCLTLGNSGEKYLGGRLLYRAALPIAKRLHKEKPFDIFISYKETDSNGNRTKDSIEAQKLYEKLTPTNIYKKYFGNIFHDLFF